MGLFNVGYRNYIGNDNCLILGKRYVGSLLGYVCYDRICYENNILLKG